MGISKVNDIVILKIPAGITADRLKKSLKELINTVNRSVKGVLVDVSSLNYDEEHFKEIAKKTAKWARANIDPQLYNRNVRKLAFVSPNGKFFGSEGAGPIVKDNAPAKHYFSDKTKAMDWLNSNATFINIATLKVQSGISPNQLKVELQNLVNFVKGRDVSGVLVDVSELNNNDAHFRKLGASVGPWARKNIDPKLFSLKVRKVAFVSPNNRYHGSAGKGPISVAKAPLKHYFNDHGDAMNWLHT